MGEPGSASTITQKLNALALDRASGSRPWAARLGRQLRQMTDPDLVAAFDATSGASSVSGNAIDPNGLNITPAETAFEQRHLDDDFRPETKVQIMKAIGDNLRQNIPASYDVEYGSKDTPPFHDVKVTLTTVAGRTRCAMTFRAPDSHGEGNGGHQS